MPAGALKRDPSRLKVDVATARHHLGLDLAAKAAVKRHNGVGIGRQQTGLHPHENHLGGDDQQHGRGDRDQNDKEALPDGVATVLGHRGRVPGVPLAQAKGPPQQHGQQRRDLRGDPVGGHGQPGGAKGLAKGGQALPELQGRGRGDDDVRPGGAQLHGGEGGGQQAELARDGPRDGGAAEGGGDAQDDGAGEAAEVGGPAGGGAQEPVDAAQGGGG